jgi:hypothetical protein
MTDTQFLPPSYDVYSGTHPILSLALDEPPPFRLASGYRLDELGRIRRLLALHRRALAAEREGVRTRADFYWGEVIGALRSLWSDAPAWEALAAHAGGYTSGAQLRDALVSDILMDTHRGLFMAFYDDDAKIGNRAFVHGAYLRSLVTIAKLPRQRAFAILRPLVEREIAACRRSEQWARARTLASWMMDLNPDTDTFHDLLVEIEVQALSRELSDESTESAAARDARTVQSTIDRIADSLRRHPTTLSFFDALAQLYRISAVRLANSGLLARALVAIETALAYGEHDGETESLKRQLVDLMTEKQKAVQRLLAEVARTPNAQLNDAGRQMQLDATIGMRSADEFRTNRLPAIAKNRARAQESALFRRIGIAVPEGNTEQIADDLRAAINFVSNRAGTNSDPAAIWDDAVKHSRRLRAVDRDGVLRFLQNALRGDPEEQVLARLAGTFTAPQPSRGQEPFSSWLYSRRNIVTKILASAAVLTLLIGGMLALRSTWVRHTRETAFLAARTAAAAEDDQAILRAAEEFFDSTAPRGEDPSRTAEVQALYGGAVARRFLASKGNSDTREITEYQQRLASMTRKGETQ